MIARNLVVSYWMTFQLSTIMALQLFTFYWVYRARHVAASHPSYILRVDE